uniref:Alkylated DNA repair protein AlkB homologue 8 N-terminal domain-containing protein n=1 Tax=Knipowitschia caucasica TaxID=637954 RepID=A0AAV2LFS2_KNICA
MDSPITSVESFRFLGTTITQDLKWEPTISSLIKKAQQRMYFLRQLRKAKLPAQMLVQFYTAIIESILTSSVTVWFAGATVRDKQRLQRIVRSAEEVIGRSLPSLQDLVIEFALALSPRANSASPANLFSAVFLYRPRAPSSRVNNGSAQRSQCSRRGCQQALPSAASGFSSEGKPPAVQSPERENKRFKRCRYAQKMEG